MNKVSESNLIKEHIYVLKSENVKTTFSRVKFLGYIRPGMVVCLVIWLIFQTLFCF